MAIGIVLIIGGFILFLLPIPFIGIVGIILFLYGVYRTLVGLKKFIFEVIDHANGTSSGANPHARKKDYTAEARRACEAVTPKKDKDSTPPWEE